MSMNKITATGRESARSIYVWDPLVRFIHWLLAFLILLNGFILDEESMSHEWVGYVAVGLIVVRLIWGVIGSRYARLSLFPPNPKVAIHHLYSISKGDKTVHLSHNPLGALMVYNIWATVLLLGATGYMMGTVQFFGVEWVEETHEMAFNWLVFSIILHVIGVVFETKRTGVPIIRAMINGYKRIPKGRSIE